MNISRKVLLVILASQMFILGIAFWGFSAELKRSHLQREARVFQVTTNLQYSELLLNPDTSASEAMIATARHISRMPGLLGVTLFNDTGTAVLSVPEQLPAADLQTLEKTPQARMLTGGAVENLRPRGDGYPGGPVLQIDIPLPGVRGEPVAFIRFYRDASGVAAEINRQKQNLLLLGALAILLSTGITSFVFIFNDRRLRRNERMLRAKNEQLLNAQRHLLLSSQMNAVGSMTAHLIHDLKSYSSRITMQLMALNSRKNGEIRELKQVHECAAEMDRHIREFLGFLRSNASEFQSTYAVADLLEILRKKFVPVAEKGRITLDFSHAGPAFELDFKKGNFLLLILQNLLHNAIECTPEQGRVVLTAERNGNTAEFVVLDEGPGIPPEEQRTIFMPKHSFKQGGTGLGLAICAQMSYHIGAGISLESSGSTGSAFKVTLPLGTASKKKSTAHTPVPC